MGAEDVLADQLTSYHLPVVQMARAYGATKVITACGPSSQDYCRSLGADVVVDYTQGKQAQPQNTVRALLQP